MTPTLPGECPSDDGRNTDPRSPDSDEAHRPGVHDQPARNGQRPRRLCSLPDAPSRDEQPLLTKREVEIAQLIADGLTNQQIASQLVIARRTAESHVEHILTKLGYATRTQVASWVFARQNERGGARTPGVEQLRGALQDRQ